MQPKQRRDKLSPDGMLLVSLSSCWFKALDPSASLRRELKLPEHRLVSQARLRP
jgi:hypothetical protein